VFVTQQDRDEEAMRDEILSWHNTKLNNLRKEHDDEKVFSRDTLDRVIDSGSDG
jgi:hypothetical protein